MTNNYDDILNMPHHVSPTRPQMSMIDRAAQFSPFAALVGYDAAIKETGRLTDAKIELDDEKLNDLNMKFQFLMEHLDDEPEVTITYFKADDRKEGGAYLKISGVVKKIDAFDRVLVLTDGKKIEMDAVLDVDGDIFLCLA